jgi:hypothetical protein
MSFRAGIAYPTLDALGEGNVIAVARDRVDAGLRDPDNGQGRTAALRRVRP